KPRSAVRTSDHACPVWSAISYRAARMAAGKNFKNSRATVCFFGSATMSDTPRANAQSIRELIAFRIGEQEYSVDVRAVREIRGWTPAMRLPHSPDYVLGVINLRGQALPIVDLAARMGFAPAKPTSRHAIIVAEIENEDVGLLVDGVSEIFSA